MDVTVAFYFYHLGVSHGVYHYWYFGLTITFILVRALSTYAKSCSNKLLLSIFTQRTFNFFHGAL